MTTVTESFNKADGAGWGPDQTWDQFGGTAHSTTSNAASVSSNGQHYGRVVAGLQDDQYCEALQSAGWHNWGVLARVTDVNNWYQVRNNNANPDKLEIRKRVGGTISVLATGTTTISNGDVLRIECEGTAIRGYINGNLEISTTDSAHTGGDPGLYINRAAMRVDDWEAGDLGSAPAAAPWEPPRRTLMYGNVHR